MSADAHEPQIDEVSTVVRTWMRLAVTWSALADRVTT